MIYSWHSCKSQTGRSRSTHTGISNIPTLLGHFAPEFGELLQCGEGRELIEVERLELFNDGVIRPNEQGELAVTGFGFALR